METVKEKQVFKGHGNELERIFLTKFIYLLKTTKPQHLDGDVIPIKNVYWRIGSILKISKEDVKTLLKILEDRNMIETRYCSDGRLGIVVPDFESYFIHNHLRGVER